MFYHPESNRTFADHSAIRQGFLNVIFDRSITESNLAYLGIVQLAQVTPDVAPGQIAIENDPVEINGEWRQDWTVRAMTPDEQAQAAARLAALKIELAAQIDDAVEARTSKSTRFAMEYQSREAAAQAYRFADYSGDPTEWISRFAGNAGLTNKQATDLILQQADGLRAALAVLGGLRMDKYLVQTATTEAEATAIAADVLSAIAAVVIP